MTVLPTVRRQLLVAAEAQAAGAAIRPRWRRHPQRPLVPRAGAVVAALSFAVALGVAALAVVLLHGARRNPAHPARLTPARLLSRPLHLPRLGPGGRCPTSTGYAVHNRFFAGPALGRGPVRVLIGNRGDVRHGRIVLGFAGKGPPHIISTLWYAVPGYNGPFVVRAARLGRPGRIRVEPGEYSDGRGPFVGGAGLNAALNTYITKWRHGHVRAPLTGGLVPTVTPAAGYRTVPSSTWVKSPGCYAWQVDGRGFSEVIVFEAVRLPHPR